MSEIKLVLVGEGTKEAPQINLYDSTTAINYGASVQRKLKSFSDSALSSARSSDVEAAGNLLLQMSSLIHGFDEVGDSIFSMLWPARKQAKLQKSYRETSQALERVLKQLDGQRMILQVDLLALESTYQQLMDTCQELTELVQVGRQQLELIRAQDLSALQQQAEASGAPDLLLLARDLDSKCQNFEKRLYDLDTTKTACLQVALQVQLAQEVKRQLILKIKDGINTAFPLWQQSIANLLTVEQSKTVFKASNAELIATVDEALALQTEYRKKVKTELSVQPQY